MKFKIFKFKSVKSTNDKAIQLIRKNKFFFGCIYADLQTRGRGTYGKKWVSARGNFFGSIFFPLKKIYPSFDQFSLINPIIISSIIKNLCNKKKIKLKYPNDIFLNRRKICGILQEVISINNKNFLIIGIGININSNPVIKQKYKATNILRETKVKTDSREIANLLTKSYENFFINLKSFNYSYLKRKTNLMALDN